MLSTSKQARLHELAALGMDRDLRRLSRGRRPCRSAPDPRAKASPASQRHHDAEGAEAVVARVCPRTDLRVGPRRLPADSCAGSGAAAHRRFAMALNRNTRPLLPGSVTAFSRPSSAARSRSGNRRRGPGSRRPAAAGMPRSRRPCGNRSIARSPPSGSFAPSASTIPEPSPARFDRVSAIVHELLDYRCAHDIVERIAFPHAATSVEEPRKTRSEARVTVSSE